jgi:SAM-dependent methyltransferase
MVLPMDSNLERTALYLCRATRMLAFLGASLKLQANPAAAPGTRELVKAGARLAIGGGDLRNNNVEAKSLLRSIEMAFAEGGELFRHPEREAAWKVDNTKLLQAMTRASSDAFSRILALAESRPLLRNTLRGMFLDVGTGGGGIALKAAETCPELQVDAIDVWEPALALAKQNIAASGHTERVRLHNLDVTALKPGPRYTLVWLPTMFLSRSVLEQALDRIHAASCEGAFLVAAVYTVPDDPFMSVVSRLRTLRSGGEVTDPAEIAAMLRSRGYADIERDAGPVAEFVFGRRS